jgi:hypothetical protein
LALDETLAQGMKSPVASMRVWQALERFFLVAWARWVTGSLPLKALYFVLASCLAFGLIAGIAYFGFGHDAESQVLDFAQGWVTIIAIVGLPVLLTGLFMFFVRRAEHKLESAADNLDKFFSG